MAKRREHRFMFGDGSNGVTVVVTRMGLEVGGWYDSMVGLEGGFITWDELDKVRLNVNQKEKQG